MSVECGSQIVLCDLPVRLDTYAGCSHACAYCFVKAKVDISDVKPDFSEVSLRSFIAGKRTVLTNWCDWNIPIHVGGVSDPFQPAEKVYKNTKRMLEVFAETGYPFVFSTKGRLAKEPEYLNLIRRCNCVGQVSIASPEYDEYEKGAPPFAERLEIVRALAANTKRCLCRVQPYLPQHHASIFASLEAFAEAGAFGVIVEGMKYKDKRPGTERVAGDFCYKADLLRKRFAELRKEAHRLGMKFYSGENRLRGMGDGLCCCGVEGVLGFVGNTFNYNHFLFAPETAKATPAMKRTKTGSALHSIFQTTVEGKQVSDSSLCSSMTSDKVKKLAFKVYALGGKK